MQVPPPEKRQRKETLLSAELGKYVDKRVRVKFHGGKEGKFGMIFCHFHSAHSSIQFRYVGYCKCVTHCFTTRILAI